LSMTAPLPGPKFSRCGTCRHCMNPKSKKACIEKRAAEIKAGIMPKARAPSAGEKREAGLPGQHAPQPSTSGVADARGVLPAGSKRPHKPKAPVVIDFPDGRGHKAYTVSSDESSDSDDGSGDGDRPGERNPKRARQAAEVKKSLSSSYDARVPPPSKAGHKARAGVSIQRVPLTVDNSPTLRTLSTFEGDWKEKLKLQRRLVERYTGEVHKACDRIAGAGVPTGVPTGVPAGV